MVGKMDEELKIIIKYFNKSLHKVNKMAIETYHLAYKVKNAMQQQAARKKEGALFD